MDMEKTDWRTGAQDPGLRKLLALAVAVALAFGVAVNGNHYLNFGAEPAREYTVIETIHNDHSKGGDDYFCVIELEPGVEKKIPLTFDQYMALDAGDTVEVFYGSGAFGVKYAYFVGIGGNTDG